MSVKRVAILGSTGSIGTAALEIAARLPDRVQIVALAAGGKQLDLFEEQIRKFSPKRVALFSEESAAELCTRVPSHIDVLSGMEGLEELVSSDDVDFVLSAIAGTNGIRPTIAAIRSGKDVGLANKEVLVSAGKIVMQLVEDRGVNLIPVDSEHSAIFQCLVGEDREAVSRIVLTASGGAFRECTLEELQNITVEKALCHPNWEMGPKVTVDSSTLMNKGLEVIEAHWLFQMPLEKIDVVIHPQSIIHSMVEYVDLSTKVQLSEPTMLIPIQYALTYPDRVEGGVSPFPWGSCSSLTFAQPDCEKFPCLDLAYRALEEGRSLPGYMNAANEVLVERFLNREISWFSIGKKLEHLMQKHLVQEVRCVENVLEIDRQARQEASVA